MRSRRGCRREPTSWPVAGSTPAARRSARSFWRKGAFEGEAAPALLRLDGADHLAQAAAGWRSRSARVVQVQLRLVNAWLRYRVGLVQLPALAPRGRSPRRSPAGAARPVGRGWPRTPRRRRSPRQPGRAVSPSSSAGSGRARAGASRACIPARPGRRGGVRALFVRPGRGCQLGARTQLGGAPLRFVSACSRSSISSRSMSARRFGWGSFDSVMAMRTLVHGSAFA